MLWRSVLSAAIEERDTLVHEMIFAALPFLVGFAVVASDCVWAVMEFQGVRFGVRIERLTLWLRAEAFERVVVVLLIR